MENTQNRGVWLIEKQGNTDANMLVSIKINSITFMNRIKVDMSNPDRNKRQIEKSVKNLCTIKAADNLAGVVWMFVLIHN